MIVMVARVVVQVVEIEIVGMVETIVAEMVKVVVAIWRHG